ncbi:MAG TPA: hypothetical protein VGN12_25500 [Pirellulales bacterium]|jgi:hypothetical protein
MKSGQKVASFIFLLLSWSIPSNAQSTPHFVHKATLDLSRIFCRDGDDGGKPRSLVFDGKNAFIGGANYENPTVGIVKIANLLDGGRDIVSLEKTRFRAPSQRGYDSLTFDIVHNHLIASYDSGHFGTSFVRCIDPDSGETVWDKTGFEAERPVCADVDPVGDSGKPAVAYLLYQPAKDGVQMKYLSVDKGAPISPGAVIRPSPQNFRGKLQSIAFGVKGDIAIVGYGGIALGNRAESGNGNKWKQVNSEASGTSSVAILDDAEVCMKGRGAIILTGVGPGGSDLLAFSVQNPRSTNTSDMHGVVQSINSCDVQFRRLDGSTAELGLTSLAGNEDGTGRKWSDRPPEDPKKPLSRVVCSKSLWFGPDASKQKRVLLVLDTMERRLDVYEIISP